MAGNQPHESLIDRRVRKIANARSVTFGLAVTFVLLALVGAVVERIVDPHDFPTLGLALWWSLQTVTTVGYGDVTPTTQIGRLIGGIDLVLGVSFIAFLTAGVHEHSGRGRSRRSREAEPRAAGGAGAHDRRGADGNESGDRGSRPPARLDRVQVRALRRRFPS